ncbi:Succinate dehydrogenase assembly factor 2, mitochondrial [Daldinia childiae]|uniref:Succinate dehydrogenase assembly factor 2, mitochondrial n=1 Tax=Daldinia childiae TaxID=326645 RepID=UPI0014462CE8|nr:Succinate dehydrogenase assembly factor 2, mitochondrial [Daldinia childiae]KAF3058268.1 Succinate dehydrogenase assembly factor 2, mitochondrial [Daldinia childiae]
MASVAAVALPRAILRSAQRPSAAAVRLLLLRRPLSSTRAAQADVFAHNPPPMEPHKQRGPQDIGVGELEGTEFRVEPMRRAGEDDTTMRARLVYQSRKRGTLESDLLLSTFADEYLSTMTREQMEQYDRFLDENDWDIYYWATQEPPSNTPSSSEAPPSITTQDTNSADYAGGAEAAISEATPLDTTSSSPVTITTTTSEHLTTGGAPLSGDSSHKDPAAAGNAAAAASAEPYRTQAETGEWAQTVGTFKPAYRPVPARWRDSEVLRLLREHVKARSKERGGMAFMPSLR